MMEKDKDLEKYQKLLNELGLKEGQEYRVTVSKTLKFEVLNPSLDLSTCLPYPISEKTGTCPICQQEYEDHKHMDYFVKPEHVKAVRDFLVFLMEKHDATKNMYLKLATEVLDSVLTPKEMVLILKDLAESNPNLANQLMPIFLHFIPSEQIKYEILVGISRKLMEIEIHYDGLSRKWRTQQILHKELTSVTTEEKDIVERVVGEELNEEDYKNFLEAHEKDVKIDYFNIQSNFHRVTSRILAYAKLLEAWKEEMPYLKTVIGESMKKRKEKAVMPQFIVRPAKKARKGERPV